MIVTKKILETQYLAAFQNAYAQFPKGRIISGEEPDFVIDLGQDRIGIEITRIYRASYPCIEQQSLQEHVVCKTRELYDSLANPSVQVEVSFNDRMRLSKSDMGHLPQAIQHVVVKNLPNTSGFQYEEFTWDNRAYFPESVDFVSVYRHPRLTTSFFSVLQTARSTKESPRKLQALIDKKSRNAKKYRSKCNTLWLVIISHGEGLASFVKLDEIHVRGSFSSEFDKLFLFRFPGQVSELTHLRDDINAQQALVVDDSGTADETH